MQEVNGVEAACDILIVGGGTGGTAAALAAAEAGAQVCLLEETDWLGGQLTTQGVCTPDEQQYIETFGGTRRYYQFRQAVRRYYRTHYRLTPEAAARPYLNPGNCWVSRLSFEPKVGMAILREMVRPLEETGRLRIFYRTRAVACEMDAETGNTVVAVLARSEDGAERGSAGAVRDGRGGLGRRGGELGRDERAGRAGGRASGLGAAIYVSVCAGLVAGDGGYQ